MTYLGSSAALCMPLLLFFTQYILRLLDTTKMEFVNMILHLVIDSDTCVDRQIHTYLIIACISDNSVYLHLPLTFFRWTILDQLDLSTDEGQLIARRCR